MFRNIKADFKRELCGAASNNKLFRVMECLGNQGFQAVLCYRLCRWLMLKHIPLLGIVMQRFIEITTGISISPRADIGKGLLIYHFGGIVVHESAKIGENCTLHHGVTIGNKEPGGKAPVIGFNVCIGAGAKVLGNITIGDNCKIGANAVVVSSIPSNCTAVGIPASIKNAKI
ncbi:MAG: serine acetyltransferase [Candidatus Omnitrophica bacterium]|nr:serine acetyltransferase [Candidatus Omnitrophota bacterium]